MHADVFVAEKLWSHQQAQVIRDAERRRLASIRTPRPSVDHRWRMPHGRRLVGNFRRFAFARFAGSD